MNRLLLFSFLLGLISVTGAQTIIPAGDVFGNWDMIGSPYQVTGNIQIPPDSTLYIEPGVMVEFQGHFLLKVMGRLLALGNETDTILFTVNDTTGFADPDTSLGGWNGIKIYDIGEENDTTRLSYCKFQYGKAVGPAWFLNAGGVLCVIDFDKVVVSNCLFSRNSAGGPAEGSPSGGAIHLARSDIRLVNNTFIHNHAYDGGAVQFHESDPVFLNNHILYNHGSNHGGGIACGGASNPSFSGDAVIHNSAGSHGGGIMLWGPGEAGFSNVTVTGNTAHWGGGIGFTGFEARILNSEISNNQATWLGGGIAADGSHLTIRNSLFENDTSLSQSGAIHTWQGTLHIRDCAFNENFSGVGGAIHTDFSTLGIERSSFMNNTAQLGGALQAFDCYLMIDSCLFDSNEALDDGGGLDYLADSLVFDSRYSVSVYHSHFINNRAGRAAGGFSIQQSHTEEGLIDVTVDRCKIIDNRARQVAGFRISRCLEKFTFSNSLVSGNRSEAWTGGGTINMNCAADLHNCVFYDNHSATVYPGASSGGLGVGNGSKVNLFNCTFFSNSAGKGGGLYVHRGAEAVVTNSIFRENLPDQVTLNSVVDSLPGRVTIQFSDIHYGHDSIKIIDPVSTVHYGDGNMDVDPLFVEKISGDLHLRDESPLIGAGIGSIEVEGHWYFCPVTDMEGNPRPDPAGSRPDIGAFENMHAWPVGLDNPGGPAWDILELKAYPNPFSHAVTLEFLLPARSHVDIRVFNLTGTEVSTVLSEKMDPGLQRVCWSPGTDLDGVCIVRFSAVAESGEVYRVTGQLIGSL